MPPKSKSKTMKPLDPNTKDYKQPMQHDVEKAQAKDKIRPKSIFEQYDSKTSSKKKSKKKY